MGNRWPIAWLLAASSPLAAQDAIPVDPPASAEQEAPAAAPAAPADNGGLGEIVVTAQKREQDINDVSIAISAFSGDALDTLGVTDTRDLATLVPGFTFADSGFNTPVYTLRGIGFNEASQTASSTVGVYVDEVNLPFPVMSKGANLDLQRVEILKGPQGTLYGRNTTGGAVNYIANKPTDTFETGLTGSYGSYETADVEGYLSGPITDTLRARLALREIHSDKGWQHSLTRPDDRLGKRDKQAGRLGVDWTPVDTLKVRFTVEGWHDGSEPQAPQAVLLRAQNPILGNAALSPEVAAHPLVPFDTDNPRVADWPDEPPLGKPFKLRDHFLMGTVRSDWALRDDLDLTVLGAVEQFKSNGTSLPQSGLSVEYVTDRIIDVDTKAKSLEARLSGEIGDTVHWLAGAFVSGDKVSEVQDYFVSQVSAVFPAPVTPPDEINALLALAGLPQLGASVADRIVLLGSQDADTQAGFANVEWKFADPLKLTVGARYTHEKRTFSGCSADSPGRTQGVGFGTVFTVISLAQGGTGASDPDNPLCFTIDQETHNKGLSHPDPLDEDNLSGRVALDWTPVAGELMYASFSRGFKSGSFPVLSSSRSDQYEPVTQERLHAWEVGAKNTLLDARLQLNVAAFLYDYKDKQLLSHLNDPIFGPLPVLANAPKSRVTGVEGELQWSPLDGLFLSAAASYLDTEIRRFSGIDNDGHLQDYRGEPFNFAPQWIYTFLANYTRPIGHGLEIVVGGDAGHTGQTNSQLGRDPRFAQDEYTLVNARLGIATVDGRWKVTAWGRNITDEYYVVGVFNPGDTIGRYTGMGRTFGLTVAWTGLQ